MYPSTSSYPEVKEYGNSGYEDVEGYTKGTLDCRWFGCAPKCPKKHCITWAVDGDPNKGGVKLVKGVCTEVVNGLMTSRGNH